MLPTEEQRVLAKPVPGPACILPVSGEAGQVDTSFCLDTEQTALILVFAQAPRRHDDLQFKIETVAALKGIPS